MYVFDRLWPKHRAHISEIASHIGRLTRLMRTGISLEHIQQEHEFRKHALEGFKRQTREAGRQEFQRVMTSLNPPRYDDNLYRLHGVPCREAGGWLFTEKTFTEWRNNPQDEARILWLEGIPGAGRHISPSLFLHGLPLRGRYKELQCWACSTECYTTLVKPISNVTSIHV